MMASSETINGGLTVSVSADTIQIRRSGKGASIPSGTRVDIRVASILLARPQKKPWHIDIQALSDQSILFRLEANTTIMAWPRNEGE
jgi:hypothetical protein